MRSICILSILLTLFSCSKEDDKVNYMELKVDGQNIYESFDFQFEEDLFLWEGGNRTLKIRIWKGKEDGEFGFNELNEITSDRKGWSSSFHQSSAGVIQEFDHDNIKTSGHVKVNVYDREGNSTGFADLIWKNADISMSRLSDGFLCGKMNQINKCFTDSSYKMDSSGNHDWTIYNTFNDYILFSLAPDQLKVGNYPMQKEYTPNEVQSSATIWYKEKNGDHPVRIKTGNVEIFNKVDNIIYGQINAVIESLDGELILEEVGFELRSN